MTSRRTASGIYPFGAGDPQAARRRFFRGDHHGSWSSLGPLPEHPDVSQIHELAMPASGGCELRDISRSVGGVYDRIVGRQSEGYVCLLLIACCGVRTRRGWNAANEHELLSSSGACYDLQGAFMPD